MSNSDLSAGLASISQMLLSSKVFSASLTHLDLSGNPGCLLTQEAMVQPAVFEMLSTVVAPLVSFTPRARLSALVLVGPPGASRRQRCSCSALGQLEAVLFEGHRLGYRAGGLGLPRATLGYQPVFLSFCLWQILFRFLSSSNSVSYLDLSDTSCPLDTVCWTQHQSYTVTKDTICDVAESER